MFSRFFKKKPKTLTLIEKKPKSFDSEFKLTWITSHEASIGNIGISQAPGKKMEKGRNGKKFDRDLANDIKFINETHQINTIVCLLNKYELRTIGINLEEYQKLCQFYKIKLIVYPIIEMSAPTENFDKFHNGLIRNLIEELISNHNILIHCRGGIGRAGTIACCLLLVLGEKNSVNESVQYLRKIRDNRCVESRKQYDFLKDYYDIFYNNY